MSLIGQTVECPLHPLQQQAPSTSAPIGRLASLRNAVANRFEGGADGLALKVEQRLGFRQVTKEIRNPDRLHWGVVSDDIQGFASPPTLMTSLERQLVVIADAKPHVLAENAPVWSQFPYIIQTTKLRQEPVYASNTTTKAPDCAVIGNVTCRVWKEAVGDHFVAYVTIVDLDGTPLRLPTGVADSSDDAPLQLKVVSDGAFFYVFASAGPAMQVVVFAPSGHQEAQNEFIEIDSATRWDVQYGGQCLGVKWWGQGGGDEHNLYWFSYTTGGGLVTNHLNLSSSLPGLVDSRAFWLMNPFDPTHAYVGIVGAGGPAPVKVIKIDSSGTIVRQVSMVGTDLLHACEGTGYVDAAGTVHTYVSVLDTVPNSPFNYTKASHKTTGNVLTSETIQSVTLASRTFLLRGRPTNVLYFTDGLQPTFFLIDLESQQIVGTWAHGIAAQDWQLDVSGEGVVATTDSWSLPSPFVDLQGNVHTVAGYLAETFTKDVITFESTGTGKGSISSVDTSVQVSCVGIAAITFGATDGAPVEYADELFLPGTQATVFTGSVFSEDCFSLFPSPFTVTQSNSDAGNLQRLGVYSWVVVFEWTDTRGNRVRSRPSDPQIVTLTGTNNIVTLSGPTLYMTEGKDNITISVYRTFLAPGIPGVPSSQHKKITNDQIPLLNNKGTVTWTFIDNVTDVACSVGETLYTDTGLLPNDPAPAFSTGCVAGNRVFLLGWDGAIWYSSEKQEGLPLVFNVDVLRQMMPTSDPVRNLMALDSGRLVILCENSVWEWDLGGLPGPDGLGGTVKAPTRLPFNNGSKGTATLIKEGIAYDSSAGGCWLITRDLQNVQLSAAAVDDFGTHSIAGIATDNDQRQMFGLANTQTALVRDGINGVWSAYSLPSQCYLVHHLRGKFCYADATSVRVQEDGLYADVSRELVAGNDGEVHADVYTPVIMDIQTAPIRIGSVKGMKTLWQILITGEYKGPHRLLVTAGYETEDGDFTEAWTVVPDPSEPYVWEFEPMVEEVSAVTLRFQSDFTGIEGGNGNAFALEFLSFFLGINAGLVRTPPTVRRGQSA